MDHPNSLDSHSSRKDELFAQALAVPAADRAGLLRRLCADDASLQADLIALLQSHDDASHFMESAPSDLGAIPPAAVARIDEQAGDRIGRYKLLQKIGEGGCGIVYMAEQEESVQRRVALKVIKIGMDTKCVIARFEAERQALARMEHPNIARVLDAGATRSGRPFFVMELVRGLRITDYCDQNNLSTEQRLALFITVCHAIQHAHQKGVIHRDIKPSNILVTLHDGEPVPKVIDFGIAKATHGRLTDQTLFTAFEQFIGTPAYVSPEQAEMSGLDIDTRSDIYSLGVLLYELLMGRTPLDTTELVEAGIDEMRRRIREEEPARPSHRLRTLNDSDRTTVARRRGTDAPRLSLQLRGDLDWIVMRCLEKDRSRRYETASALAADIQRHLQNEPVTARPPSTAYLMQKLMRRHRLAFGAGAGIAAALAAGFTVSTSLYLQERATHERARVAEAKALAQMMRAEIASANEGRLRAEAEAARNHAQNEADRRAKLAALMSGTMKDMGLLIALGGDRRGLRDVLEQTANLRRELSDQPEIAAGVDETLGGAYFKLGDFARAEELFRDALTLRRHMPGENAASIAQSLNYLGLVFSGQSRWLNAETCHREALELQQRALGTPHREVARTLSTLGWVLGQQARPGEAEHYLRLALEQQRALGSATQPDVAATLMRLGSVLTQEGRVQEAEKALAEAVDLNRAMFGRWSLEVASSLNLLAVTIALNQVRLPEAIGLYREAFEIRARIARPAADRTQPVPKPTSGSFGEFRDALSLARADSAAALPLPPLETMLSQHGDMAVLENALRDSRRFAQTQYASESWEEAFYLALTVWVQLQERKFDEAEALAGQCLAIRLKLRPEDWSAFHARHLLGAAKAGKLRFAEAGPLLIEGYRGMRERIDHMPPFHLPRLGESVQRIIAYFAVLGQSDEVARWQVEFNGLPPEARQSLLTPAASASETVAIAFPDASR